MKLSTKALTGLAALTLAAGGVLNATASHAFTIKNGWAPLGESGDVQRAGAIVRNMPALADAGCAEGSSWTLVLRPFNDPDGDGRNNDLEPQGAPHGLIRLFPGNPVAPSWRLYTDVVFQDSQLTLYPGMMVNPPAPAPGTHRYAMGALCVTDTGEPDWAAKEVILDAHGNPLGQWFTLDITSASRETGPATYTMVNQVPAFADAQPGDGDPTPPTPPPGPRTIYITVSTTPAIEHTVDRRVTLSSRPTATVIYDGMITYTVTGPTATVTVPGPIPPVVVTVAPDPFKAKCHTEGVAKPWWCTLEDFYWALVKGWIN